MKFLNVLFMTVLGLSLNAKADLAQVTIAGKLVQLQEKISVSASQGQFELVVPQERSYPMIFDLVLDNGVCAKALLNGKMKAAAGMTVQLIGLTSGSGEIVHGIYHEKLLVLKIGESYGTPNDRETEPSKLRAADPSQVEETATSD